MCGVRGGGKRKDAEAAEAVRPGVLPVVNGGRGKVNHQSVGAEQRLNASDVTNERRDGTGRGQALECVAAGCARGDGVWLYGRGAGEDSCVGVGVWWSEWTMGDE